MRTRVLRLMVAALACGLAAGPLGATRALGQSPGAPAAATPIPLSDVFALPEPVSIEPTRETAPAAPGGPTAPTGETPSRAASATPVPVGDVEPRLPRSIPTPFVADPMCPPGAIPPLALLPTPTQIPTPSPTAVPLPEGMSLQDLYAPPGHMGRRKDPIPLFSPQPGLLADRAEPLAEVEIVNVWEALCVEVTLIPEDVAAIGGGGEAGADARKEDPRWVPGRAPTTLLLPPGVGDSFRLPPGEWRARLRVWEPEPPYPERVIEYPAQPLVSRGRYRADLTEEQEATFRAETHPIVVETRERRMREDPLSRLGKPEPTPIDLLRIGTFGSR